MFVKFLATPMVTVVFFSIKIKPGSLKFWGKQFKEKRSQFLNISINTALDQIHDLLSSTKFVSITNELILSLNLKIIMYTTPHERRQ